MKRALTGLVCVIVLATSGFAAAKTKHGDALTKIMREYYTWALGVGQPDHDGEIMFVPTPPLSTFDPVTLRYSGQTDFTLGRDDSFFLPVFVFFGEKRADGTSDSPSVIGESDFTSSDIEFELDGKSLKDDDLDDIYVDTTYFDPPVVYPAPSTTTAIWVKGLGFLHKPLNKGSHTLHFHVTSQWLFDHYGYWGWDNTWNFTVTKGK